MTDKFDNYDKKLKQYIETMVTQQVNLLGDEIANDVNMVERKLKDLRTQKSSFDALTKEAMLTLEKKFDKAMENKPVVRTVKQKVDYK